MVSADAITRVIEELGYEPTVMAAPLSERERGMEQVDLDSLPDELKSLFEAARDATRPVLLDFTAPG